MEVIPEWAKAMRKPNTEVKKLNGNYYLYEVHCIYDKKTKKKRKGKSTYLGKLVEGIGLIPKGEMKQKIVASIPSSIVEYGISATVPILLNNEIAALKKCFPKYWKTIIGMAYSRLVYQSPIKDMDQHWNRSYLSQMLPETAMSADYISGMIRVIGDRRDIIDDYFKEFKACGDTIIFDGTDIGSESTKMTDVRLSKTKRGDFGTVINVMVAFSIGLNSPLYYRILRGNIKDVKSFILCVKELGITNAIIIVDKGFFSNNNLSNLDELGMDYIIPLKRNDERIDYSKAEVDYLSDGGEAFRYHGRQVFGYRQQIDESHQIDLFVDNEMRSKETADFMKRIGDNDGTDTVHTWENFRERRKRMGTIAFITRASMTMAKTDKDGNVVIDENGKEVRVPTTPNYIYKSYKKRNCVEEEIDVFKNKLDADKTYMQDRYAEEGWMFTNFVALQWYYRLLNKLDETNLDSSYSAMTVLGLLQDVRKVKIGGEWLGDPLTNKEARSVAALGLDLGGLACIP